jgi:hypothetical protein
MGQIDKQTGSYQLDPQGMRHKVPDSGIKLILQVSYRHPNMKNV